MQRLLSASESGLTDDACAREVLDAVPLVMRVIRNHMRRHRYGLTVPQFRALCFVSTSAGTSLSAVADFIGLSLPAMSRLVDALVEKRLMERRESNEDRRSVSLFVTPRGESTLGEARQMAQDELSRVMSGLSQRQRTALVSTMATLRDLFAPEAQE